MQRQEAPERSVAPLSSHIGHSHIGRPVTTRSLPPYARAVTDAYSGFYVADDMTVVIAATSGGWQMSSPGVPSEFAAPLHAIGKDRFTIGRGQFEGARLHFSMNERVSTGFLVGGEHEFRRVAQLPRWSPGHGLVFGEGPDSRHASAFQDLLQGIMERRDGALLPYDLSEPKHEFVRYVSSRDAVIFHGSKRGDIDEFSTRRTSLELKDSTGRGNLPAVYGTHDGIWAMFFAAIDRENLTGSIRNGVTEYVDERAARFGLYHFTINQDLLDGDPWSPGTLYVLPRDAFRRLPLSDEGGWTNEWVSETPVRPLARLTIEPDDFPFRRAVGGHDDSALLRASELGRIVREAAVAVRRRDEGFALQLDWTDELAAQVDEYLTLLSEFMPAVNVELRHEADGAVVLDMQGPPAWQHVMEDSLADRL